MTSDNLNIIGLVCARGGSKGVPRKNLRLLGGKPLIAYAIQTGLACPSLKRLIVSTEDEEIGRVASSFGAEVPFRRPAELARDASPEWLVWQHAARTLEAAGERVDVLLSLPPTSPLRSAEDVEACLALLLQGGCDAVITVRPAERNPYFNMVALKDDFVELAARPPVPINRRQEAPDVYDVTTVAYALRRDFLMNASHLFEGRLKAVIVPRERALDIDTEMDFAIAECLLRESGQQGASPAEIQIGSRRVGEGHPCFIIAEAGVNHNGDLALAKQLVDAAAAAGADAVKFQSFQADRLVSPGTPKARYQQQATGAAESQGDMLRRLALGAPEQRELYSYCQQRGLIFLSTPFDQESVDLLQELGVPAFKIGSGEVTNLPFLRYVAAKGRPVILSTGMSYLDEVKEAVQALRDAGCAGLALMHCTSSYPAAPAGVNLRAMTAMTTAFKLPVGYSDHTPGAEVAPAAVAMGACIIEKHFTLDRDLPGPDHRASLEPQELRALVAGIKAVESALGDGVKRPVASEEENRMVIRRSLAAATAIPEGAVISADMLTALRPASGISPALLGKITGRRARRALSPGQIINWSDLA